MCFQASLKAELYRSIFCAIPTIQHTCSELSYLLACKDHSELVAILRAQHCARMRFNDLAGSVKAEARWLGPRVFQLPEALGDGLHRGHRRMAQTGVTSNLPTGAFALGA